jgi:vacuolar-type H+-ATPase subunit I/STV1
LLVKAGLTDEQVVAIQEAQELKATGDMVAAKETLAAAGITQETMRQISEVAKEAKQAVKDAVAAGDYEAFKLAIIDSPLEELITTEADFNQFMEAHKLRQVTATADTSSAVAIGRSDHVHKHHKKHRGLHAEAHEQLTNEQREALMVAHMANDKDAVRAIFAEAGIELPVKGKQVR